MDCSSSSSGNGGDEESLERGGSERGSERRVSSASLMRQASLPNFSNTSNSSKSNLTRRKRGKAARVSRALDIATGKEESGREHYAQIRPEAESKPMGKLERRNQHMARFFNIGRWPAMADLTSSHHDSVDPKDEKEAESVTLSQHHRMNVRAAHKTEYVQADVSSDDEMLAVLDDDSERSSSGRRRPQSSHFETTTQFRLNAARPSNSLASRTLRLVGINPSNRGIYDDAGAEDDGCSICGFAPNSFVTKYLHWTFRQSFSAVFFSAAIGFFSLTLAFGLLILWIGQYQPECIHVNGENFSNYTGATVWRDFGDAYALSWTSFSTVGYGLVYPSTSSVHPDQVACIGVEIVCVLESFVGILFASFCGAIMFGKVARIRSHAQVTFSDAVVVRYGTGVLSPDGSRLLDDENGSVRSGQSDDEEQVQRNYPCPVLEFRIANRLHSTIGGEIMDCSMNIVASIDEAQADHMLRKTQNQRRRRKGKAVRRNNKRPKNYGLQPVRETESSSDLNAANSLDTLAKSIRQRATVHTQAFEEDPSGRIVPKRIFCKLEIENPDHPFFKRVWTARHTLDLESPILAEEAKQMIRLNNGFWPHEMDDAASVRACINVDQILVSLSGTSNADANSVYAQKVYDFHDVNVGYRFVHMIYRDEGDGHLKADLSVINDVVEQAGGGGEQLLVADQNMFTEILVL